MPNINAPEYYVMVTRVVFKDGKIVLNVYGLWDKLTAQEEAKKMRRYLKSQSDDKIRKEDVYVRKLGLNLETPDMDG